MKSLHSLHNISPFFTVIFNGYLSNFKNRKMSQWDSTIPSRALGTLVRLLISRIEKTLRKAGEKKSEF